MIYAINKYDSINFKLQVDKLSHFPPEALSHVMCSMKKRKTAIIMARL